MKRPMKKAVAVKKKAASILVDALQNWEIPIKRETILRLCCHRGVIEVTITEQGKIVQVDIL